jgi:glutamate-1-semialdehyde 2,1-aminomutase
MAKPAEVVEGAALLARAKGVIPSGTSSGNRAPWNEVMVRAEGAYLWNADGQRFVDYLLAWGPIVLGHCHPRVNDAVARAAATCDLTAIGPQVGEVELAEAVCEVMPSADRVAFCTSGTEATMHALQVARAATGRTKVLKFHGSYHGWHDSLAVGSRSASGPAAAGALDQPDAGGVLAGATADTIVAEWNDLDAVRRAFELHGEDMAAVFCEPYVLSYGCVPPAEGFLEELRALCTSHGAALVFDEVKTAFRASLGGYQSLCGVTPDLTAFAKAIANGYPVAGVAGRADLMDTIGGATGAAFAGTYNAAPFAVAAGLATFEELRAGAIERIWRLGERVRQGLGSLITGHGVPACVIGFGSEWIIYFRPTPPANYREALESDMELGKRYQRAMMGEGILEPIFPTGDRRLCAATTDEDVDRTLEAADRVLAGL